MTDCGRKTLWPLEMLPEEDSGELAKPKVGFQETAEEELEEIASENSDSICSSTPEAVCHRCRIRTKEAEKSTSLQTDSLPVARKAENIGEYELAQCTNSDSVLCE